MKWECHHRDPLTGRSKYFSKRVECGTVPSLTGPGKDFGNHLWQRKWHSSGVHTGSLTPGFPSSRIQAQYVILCRSRWPCYRPSALCNQQQSFCHWSCPLQWLLRNLRIILFTHTSGNHQSTNQDSSLGLWHCQQSISL